MAEPKTIISVQNVSKDFSANAHLTTSVKSIFTQGFRREKGNDGIQHALKDISFEVKEGEFFGIVGRNGSGKSTLLKILAGIYQPSQGGVHVEGKLVPFIELGVGFNPELTGKENVYLNGALLGFSRAEIKSQYKDIVAFAELEDSMDKKLKNYSSGMQVRLAFSMAIRSNADILLIDEVLAVGDADFQKKCFEYFKSLKRNQKTVVFVSHDMNAIREYCDRAMLVENSVRVGIGDADEIANSYRRLFSTEKNLRGKPKSMEIELNRWGDGAIKYTNVSVSNNRIGSQKALKITVTAEAHETVAAPIFGFSVKNDVGEYLLGTNTKMLKIKTKDMQKGEKVTIEWEVPNIFADGKYFVNPAVERSDGTECDWYDEAVFFTVEKEKGNRTYYKVVPDIKASISHVV